MKKNWLLFVCLLFLAVSCMMESPKSEFVDIRFSCEDDDGEYSGRNEKDYIKLWVNDSLLFSGVYHNIYVDTIVDTYEDQFGMHLAYFDRTNIDSVKFRLRVVSLDSVYFAGDKYAVDTTFSYNVDSISTMSFSIIKSRTYFLIFDSFKDPDFFEYDIHFPSSGVMPIIK